MNQKDIKSKQFELNEMILYLLKAEGRRLEEIGWWMEDYKKVSSYMARSKSFLKEMNASVFLWGLTVCRQHHLLSP